jgi:hypothetical protein
MGIIPKTLSTIIVDNQEDISMSSVIARITQMRKTLCTKEQREIAFRKLHAFDGLEAHYNRMINNHCSSF